ncbi:uncharacterized protein UTRI_01436 [Ustilago trichophora]|uniref:Uncharacterized protein n=1 Tax=Ustilago trichophora TaxID=86804 RepID=A0A5C3DX03_9BASI|nr:uncharacterized protein UTRI_01436 [Ustilago trichophora]
MYSMLAVCLEPSALELCCLSYVDNLRTTMGFFAMLVGQSACSAAAQSGYRAALPDVLNSSCVTFLPAPVRFPNKSFSTSYCPEPIFVLRFATVCHEIAFKFATVTLHVQPLQYFLLSRAID